MLDKRSHKYRHCPWGGHFKSWSPRVVRPRPLDWRPQLYHFWQVPLGCLGVLFEELEPAGCPGRGGYQRSLRVSYGRYSTSKIPPTCSSTIGIIWTNRKWKPCTNMFQRATFTVFSQPISLATFYLIHWRRRSRPTRSSGGTVSLNSWTLFFSKDTAIVYEKAVRKSYFTKIRYAPCQGVGLFWIEGKEPLSELNFFISVSVGKGNFDAYLPGSFFQLLPVKP